MDWTRGHTIGHGSTATVSLASSLHSGEVFAVKSAELSHSQFLQREQKILSSISSPYVVGYRGCDITRDNNNNVVFNLLLEYMPGGTLIDEVQAHGGRLDESVIRHYTCQILQGLNYLHSNGWVHCDIKGPNILIGQNGAKIADFGCAKRIDTEAKVSIGGTPMFMAPEVARGEEQEFASDIWSLGCTVIEMASGGAPWTNVNNDPVSVIYRIGFSDYLPEFPCCLSEEGKDFLDKCLRRNPKERWTANQLLKHPFLGKFNYHVIQIQESNSTSNSPTSILDQGFWNSMDESESEQSDKLVRTSGVSSVRERIRRLSLISGGPSWDWDENWITVRSNCGEEADTIMNEIEGRDDVISDDSMHQESYGGDSEQLFDDLLDSNNGISSSRITGDLLGDYEYGKHSFLVDCNVRFDWDKDGLLIPSIRRLVLPV